MSSSDITSDRSSVRATITAAAAELLREGGARAVTTRSVAERAGVQAPTIYRLFGDKDGLVKAVAEAAMASYVPSTQEADDDDAWPPVDALKRAWDRHIDFGLSNPGLFALLSTTNQEELSPVVAGGIDTLRGLVRAMAVAGQLVVDEDRAVNMLHAAGSGALTALLEQPVEQRDRGLPDAMFATVLTAISDGQNGLKNPDRDVLAHVIQFRTLIEQVPALSAAERKLLEEWLARSSEHPAREQGHLSAKSGI